MVQPTRPPANGFVALSRKVYNPLGFSKGYNFVLFFIFAGALMGFTLARFQYIDFYGIFCSRDKRGTNGASPGECYYYLKGHYEIGMFLHLASIIPAAFLACFQFVPVIRHKIILLHRINGYVIILLVLAGNAGALMVARHAFGGGLDIQAAVGLLAILSTLSLALSYYNIKRLQIEQHRAWMLRAWFYMGAIITTRLIMIISATIVTSGGSYYTARPCAQIDFTLDSRNETLQMYPECAAFYSGKNPDQQALVHVDMNGAATEIGAALGFGFGMSLWLALAMHAIGVEIYLQLTPREAQRLRNVSYQRQLEAGMKNPGSAGWTVDKFGDAEPWTPSVPTEHKLEVTARGLSDGEQFQ